MGVKLVWITPKAQELIVHMARVSNPRSQEEGINPERLIRYLVKHKHWSPFEMASACFEIETTRDIGRQILRHRSFSFQEFSQRYAAADDLPTAPFRDARLQDEKNRQNSLPTWDAELQSAWKRRQAEARATALDTYAWALREGIAKEVARAVLPEGLTMSRMYMVGSFRSWLHYFGVRIAPGVQLEHRQLAVAMYSALVGQAPAIFTNENTGETNG